MNIEEQLEKEHSKENAQIIANYVGNDEERFAELMLLFFHSEYRVSQRAAHAVSHCVDRYTFLLQPYTGRMIENLKTEPEVAIRRNTVRLLQKQKIEEEYQGVLAEKCFEYLMSAKETAAVKAFSMTILYNLSQTYPDLKHELKIVIEDVVRNTSSGVVNRGNKILKLLSE